MGRAGGEGIARYRTGPDEAERLLHAAEEAAKGASLSPRAAQGHQLDKMCYI